MLELQLPGFPNTTILVMTANRPTLLARFLRYYAEAEITPPAIVIADGSVNEEALDATAYSEILSIQHLRFPPALPIIRRLRDALTSIKTPYVLMAADDDFYFLDWLDNGLAKLDSDPTYEVATGEYLTFTLSGFRSLSTNVVVSEPTPGLLPIPYLEGSTIDERIGEHAKSHAGLQTVGWYALQRTETLKRILDYGLRFNLSHMIFERFYVIAQAAAGKTEFQNGISIARQSDPDPGQFGWRKEPLGFRRNSAAIEALQHCTIEYLRQELGVDGEHAISLTTMAYRHELAMMHQADRRLWARRLVNVVPGMRQLLTSLRVKAEFAPRDNRLPQRADSNEVANKSILVRKACRP